MAKPDIELGKGPINLDEEPVLSMPEMKLRKGPINLDDKQDSPAPPKRFSRWRGIVLVVMIALAEVALLRGGAYTGLLDFQKIVEYFMDRDPIMLFLCLGMGVAWIRGVWGGGILIIICYIDYATSSRAKAATQPYTTEGATVKGILIPEFISWQTFENMKLVIYAWVVISYAIRTFRARGFSSRLIIYFLAAELSAFALIFMIKSFNSHQPTHNHLNFKPDSAFRVPDLKGNKALLDYQNQLMMLERENRKRLSAMRDEQDVMMGAPKASRSYNIRRVPLEGLQGLQCHKANANTNYDHLIDGLYSLTFLLSFVAIWFIANAARMYSPKKQPLPKKWNNIYETAVGLLLTLNSIYSYLYLNVVCKDWTCKWMGPKYVKLGQIISVTLAFTIGLLHLGMLSPRLFNRTPVNREGDDNKLNLDEKQTLPISSNDA